MFWPQGGCAQSIRTAAIRSNVVINAYGDAETKRKAWQNGAEALTDQSIGTLHSEFDIGVERAA
jgi:hypothetical protein